MNEDELQDIKDRLDMEMTEEILRDLYGV